MIHGDNDRIWTNEQLNKLRLQGDPIADRAVAAVFDRHDIERSRAMLRALIDHENPRLAGLPPELHEFLDQTSALPEWADTARLARGQAVFERWGVAISVALFCASLPSAYACANGVRVLAQTARLETDTRRRVLETGQFLIDALGRTGLVPESDGMLAIQRVRLMHAAVRQLILAHQADPGTEGSPPVWDDSWGHPINQEDLAGTLLSFSYTVVGPLPRLGIELSDVDREDYLYVWRVIGTLLGLDDSVIPHNTTESTSLVTIIRKRQYGCSTDGVLMTKALIGLLDEMTPTHLFDTVIIDLIRLLAEDEVAEILELPAPHRHYGWLTRLKVLLRISSHDVENHAVLRVLADHLGWHVLKGLFDFERQGEKRTSFDIPDHLADGWALRDDAPPARSALSEARQ
ncbi:MAG: hypothetical protein ACI8RE_002622 [Ilumatobacter sp.]|jgi:hypothetical protein